MSRGEVYVISVTIWLLTETAVHVQLLDQAYGFLCLQVMALSVQVAMLSQTGQLKPFLSAIASQPIASSQSICPMLHAHIRHLETQAMTNSQQLPITWLLGWHRDTITGRLTCLPQMGGCTIVDAKFLIERMWSARAQFLHAARWAAAIFPGWASLLHIIWNTLVQNYGGVGYMSRFDVLE
jgi:hypothetical protein